jgi:rubrerythrin
MSNTATHAELGMNRTGIGTSPKLSKDMVEGTSEFLPRAAADERELAIARAGYAREAEPIGSVPPPLTGKGVVKTAGTALKGESPTQFIDKLGERLAFERTGTRLYQALLSKFDALGGFDSGPTREELELILMQEYQHFQMLDKALTRLGADPTVMTPSADLQATLSKGILEVMVDPRTSVAQCLEAALVAELADNDCWHALSELAREAGEDGLQTACAVAVQEEAEHLVKVRRWIAVAQGR